MELSRVIHAREELRFDYAPSSGTSADHPCRVQPHHLVTWRHHWYLVAWDLHREDWRTFRVDRIRPRTPTGPRFTPRELPGGDVSAFITSRFRGNDGTTTDWPCRGEVILRLPAADVAPFAQDGIVEELGPRHCRLVLGSWSWTGLAAAIGRFDTDIEVIGPPQLVTAFGDLAARCAHAARTTGPETVQAPFPPGLMPGVSRCAEPAAAPAPDATAPSRPHTPLPPYTVQGTGLDPMEQSGQRGTGGAEYHLRVVTLPQPDPASGACCDVQAVPRLTAERRLLPTRYGHGRPPGFRNCVQPCGSLLWRPMAPQRRPPSDPRSGGT